LSNPLEMQKDFAHIRSWHKSTKEIKRKGILTVIGVLISAGLGAVWVAFKGAFHWQV
jgi:hypothetical protein